MQVVVTVAGFDQAVKYLTEVEYRLHNYRHKGLFKSVNRIADVWLDNYDSEGQRVGGWPELKEMTQARREELGYGAQHPILKRDGALRSAMVETFTKAKGKQSITKYDSYSYQTTRSSVSIDGDRVVLDAHGWKVSNQYHSTGRYGHPARPIWFVDRTVRYAARSGLVDWLVNDVVDTR